MNIVVSDRVLPGGHLSFYHHFSIIIIYCSFNIRYSVTSSGLSPRSPKAGGTAFQIQFKDNIITAGGSLSPPLYYTRLGLNIIPGQVISPTSVLFIAPFTPNQPAGIVPVEYSLNGRDFQDTGHTLQYEQAVPTTVIQTISTLPPTVFFITPTSTSAGTKSTVKVVGENFQATSKCTIGASLVPIPTVFVSKTEVNICPCICLSVLVSVCLLLFYYTIVGTKYIPTLITIYFLTLNFFYLHFSYRASYPPISLARMSLQLQMFKALPQPSLPSVSQPPLMLFPQ